MNPMQTETFSSRGTLWNEETFDADDMRRLGARQGADSPMPVCREAASHNR